jgi:alkylation response protein AidB-like acyl-CoA dehydrogenase
VAWSGEPQSRKPGEKARFGTTVERADGGWSVSGSKAFATSATGADWAILLVKLAGPGGARHASGAAESLLMLGCRLDDPSITIDDTWWDPIGMRATVSHVVRFEHTFVPDADVIGEPGSYLREGWQTAFIPHYAASFLGAAEGAYEYAIDYLTHQGKGADPYGGQRRVRAPLAPARRGPLGSRPSRRGAARRQPGEARDRAPGLGDHAPRHPRLRSAFARPAEPDRADPPRPHLLPAT